MVEMITCQQAAQRLGYTTQHVRRLVRDGKLDGVKIGRDWVLSNESVNRLYAANANLHLFERGADADGR
jgi:excisionase family DNA binding protein